MKVKGWKKIFHVNGIQKKVGVATLISDKIDFKIETVTRDKEEHYIMIKGSIQEEDIIINVYAPNIGTRQYIRQMLTTMKGEIDSNTIIVSDFNTPLTPMDRSSKQKINKETQALNDTIDWIDLIDIYRTFHPKVAEYIFFSSVHGTFSRIDHILGHKLSLRKFKKIEIVSSIFSDHNAMKLEINYRKKTVKNTNTWRLNSALLNDQGITEEIKEEIKKIHGNKWQRKHNDPKPMGRSKSRSKREVYSNSISPQVTRKISNKQSSPTLKTTRGRRTKKTQSQ